MSPFPPSNDYPPRLPHSAPNWLHLIRPLTLSESDKQRRVFDFQALRHQFISNLARSGVPAKVAQELARYSTITLTLDRYSHLLGSDVSDALKQLPALRLPENMDTEFDTNP